MGRMYEVPLNDLPRVAVPDWELVGKLERLLRPYLPTRTVGRPAMLWARDSKGTYDATSTEDLRELAEKQNELPHTIRVSAASTDPLGNERAISVFTSTEVGFGGTCAGHDKNLVMTYATQEMSSLVDGIVEGPPEANQPPSFWTRHERWALALVPVAFGVVLTTFATLFIIWLVGK